MGHPWTGWRDCGARGCLCGAPAIAQGLLTSGMSLLASALVLFWSPFLHRHRKQWVRSGHSPPSQWHQQKPEPIQGQTCLESPGSGWSGPAGKWPPLPGRNTPTRPWGCSRAPAASQPCRLPTLPSRALLSTSNDSYLEFAHGHCESVANHRQQQPQEKREDHLAEQPAHFIWHVSHACCVRERAKESLRRSSRTQLASTCSSYPTPDALPSQASCRQSLL